MLLYTSTEQHKDRALCAHISRHMRRAQLRSTPFLTFAIKKQYTRQSKSVIETDTKSNSGFAESRDGVAVFVLTKRKQMSACVYTQVEEEATQKTLCSAEVPEIPIKF